MSYIKAENVLPKEIIELLQNYVDGTTIYIPRKAGNRQKWGELTNINNELESRNKSIYNDYLSGMNTNELSVKYFLSVKSIQRIIRLLK